MPEKLLITRPNHELVVSYLYSWSKDLISLAQKSGFQVSDFRGSLANRNNFEKFVKKQRPELIFLNGHGSETEVCGHKDEPLLVDGENENILSGSIIHALSCSSAAILGKSAVKCGARAYLGYRLPFTIITDRDNESNPSQDRFAGIFKDPALEAPINLIRRKDPGESFNKAKEKYRQTILTFSASDAKPEAEYIRFALFSNMVALELIMP